MSSCIVLSNKICIAYKLSTNVGVSLIILLYTNTLGKLI